jgi:hypothetical protein
VLPKLAEFVGLPYDSERLAWAIEQSNAANMKQIEAEKARPHCHWNFPIKLSGNAAPLVAPCKLRAVLKTRGVRAKGTGFFEKKYGKRIKDEKKNGGARGAPAGGGGTHCARAPCILNIARSMAGSWLPACLYGG